MGSQGNTARPFKITSKKMAEGHDSVVSLLSTLEALGSIPNHTLPNNNKNLGSFLNHFSSMTSRSYTHTLFSLGLERERETDHTHVHTHVILCLFLLMIHYCIHSACIYVDSSSTYQFYKPL